VEPMPDGSPRDYRYVVVRLQRSGEFDALFGPALEQVP